jgi:hypothetical protein
LYGRRSEKSDPEQLQLGLEDLDVGTDACCFPTPQMYIEVHSLPQQPPQVRELIVGPEGQCQSGI